ncbi:MAG: DUF3782 domain-containing protein [Anaerolineae bacterium]|nr:DUF3782 domain-containing protein [Anaerolineae bacterium]MDW8067459.1 DUF3782 domain-containing protein [Anaerolineae bacterium]
MESQVKQIILQELPDILQRDPEVRAFILRLSREPFVDKAATESRFDRMLEALRRERGEQSRRWEEQSRRWEENQREIRRTLDEIAALRRRSDATLGALGARWGLFTEASFRSALQGILQDSWVDPAAREVAQRLGIQIYRYAEDIDPAIFEGSP